MTNEDATEATEVEDIDVDLELMITHVNSVAVAVFGTDFMFQVGYSDEHNKIVLSVIDPRIDDPDQHGITAAVPPTSESVLGARYICTKIAAQLYQVEHSLLQKSKLIVPDKKLWTPGNP